LVGLIITHSYSLNLAEEVKKGMTEKANRGGLQSTPPFGYKAEGGKLVIVPEEAKLVKFIFEQFASQQMGMRQLAVYMNDMGIKSHRGNMFENRSIEYILNNPVYIGKLRWTPTGRARRNFNHPDSIVSDGEHEPIIDIELWGKAQEAVKRAKELHKPRTRAQAPMYSWLKGLVRCGQCGKLLTATSVGSFQCNGYSKGMCKPSSSITVAKLEKVVLEELKSTFKSNLEISVIPKVGEVDATIELDLLNDRLKRLELREERIKIAFQDGIDTLEEYKANKKIILDERRNILEKLEQIKSDNICEDSDEGIYKEMESVYHLLTDDAIPMDVKYKTAHFLISTLTFTKRENSLEIEYK